MSLKGNNLKIKAGSPLLMKTGNMPPLTLPREVEPGKTHLVNQMQSNNENRKRILGAIEQANNSAKINEAAKNSLQQPTSRQAARAGVLQAIRNAMQNRGLL